MAETHRLFFALEPGGEVAAQIARAAEAARMIPGAPVRWTAAAKYHLTLHFLGDHPEAPHAIIEQAAAAAQSLVAGSLEVTLDRIDCFRGRARAPWIVCCNSASESPLLALRLHLGELLVSAGLARLLEERFTPHVTIAYGAAVEALPISITPILWRVSELVLMQSRVGQAHYDTLGRWPLHD